MYISDIINFRLRGYKTVSCSNQLSMEFIGLINVEIVLALQISISRINDWLL